MGSRLDKAYEEILNQFRNSDTILTYLEAVFNRIEDLDAVLGDLLNKRGIETAEGVWLDIIGAIVGYARPVEYILSENIFTFKDSGTDPDDSDKAFADGPPVTHGGYFQDLYGVYIDGAPLMGDDDYRVLLRAKIAATNADPSLPSIGRFISEAFGVDFEISVPTSGYISIQLETGTAPAVRFAIQKFAPVAAGVDHYVV